MNAIIWVFIGGGLGSICRYGLGRVFNHPIFPYGTLIANIVSCLILGILIGLSAKGIMKDHYRLLFVTGFCGGFSTFSAYSADMIQLFQGGHTLSAIYYMIISVIAGLLAIAIGMFASHSLLN